MEVSYFSTKWEQFYVKSKWGILLYVHFYKPICPNLRIFIPEILDGDTSRRESTEEEEIYVKDEEASLSPVNSDVDRQSGSGGEDNPHKVNRRKRKVPVKYQGINLQNILHRFHEKITYPIFLHISAPNDPSELSNIELPPIPVKKLAVNSLQESSNQSGNHKPSPKQFSGMQLFTKLKSSVTNSII